MIISHSKKFIFIHVYKVAGSSVREALQPYSHSKSKRNHFLSSIGYYPNIYSSDFSNHVSAKDVQDQITDTIFQSYFKFAFVRNPWDWQVSLYHFAKQSPDHHQYKIINKMSFEEYIDWRINENLHLQREFLYNEKGELLVDFVGRFENLDQDFKQICQKLNIPIIELQRKNSSKHKCYKDYYTSKSRELLAQAYKMDIEAFGYEF